MTPRPDRSLAPSRVAWTCLLAVGASACLGAPAPAGDAAATEATDDASDAAQFAADSSATDGAREGAARVACNGGAVACAGRCVDLASDPAHCGRCEAACDPATAECIAGACAPRVPQCPDAPGASTPAARAAARVANAARVAMGVGCAQTAAPLVESAARHCRYYAANVDRTACVADPHREQRSCALFGGERLADRAAAAGYAGTPTFEVMAYFGDPARAVQAWIDSVWHRVPVLSPWMRDAGYGQAARCDTMDFGEGAAAPDTAVAVYPYAGQRGVPLQFDGAAEVPAPPAPATGWPSGYPISVYLRGAVSTHEIRVDGAAAPLPHVFVSPATPRARDLLRDEFFLYTERPLAAATRYRVRIVGANRGGTVEREWTFTTR